MLIKKIMLLLSLFILLAGCQGELDTQDPTATKQIETSPMAANTPESSDDATGETAPESDILETEEAKPSTESDSQSEDKPTTESELFENDWDDRAIYQSGLIAGEETILNELSGASVYHMHLDATDLTTIKGRLEVQYTNQEDTQLVNIYFHMHPDQLAGDMEIDNVTLDNQTVKTEFSETAMNVFLVQPLSPGEKIVVKMDFTTRIPAGESSKYNILAFDDDILTLAHFYPMIAVYDGQGWHIEPSPAQGDETYADSSFYQVRIQAPVDQVIATSGVEVSREESGDTQTVTIAAGLMRDFYAVMSHRFAVYSDVVGQVVINSYAPPEFSEGANLALEVALAAVKSYNERYGTYPFTELDIVSTPTAALGVEYPGVFVNAIRLYDLYESSSTGLPNPILLESTTAHETAHQWFYSLVGNDQLNEPWLDESITQYATWKYYVDRYGEQNAQGYYNSLEGRWERAEFAEIPIGLPAEAYVGPEYSAIVYGRGPIFLNALEGEMGQGTFYNFLRDYSEKYKYQIATTEDFKALAEEHCQCDLTAIFLEWVY